MFHEHLEPIAEDQLRQCEPELLTTVIGRPSAWSATRSSQGLAVLVPTQDAALEAVESFRTRRTERAEATRTVHKLTDMRNAP